MRLSSAIANAQQALLARDVLRYKPSLSAEVHDALFSYWRLPIAVREQLSQRLPVPSLLHGGTGDDGAALATRVGIDWNHVAGCIQRPAESDADASPMEVTWAFALQTEALVTTLSESPAAARLHLPGIAHGDQVSKLLCIMHNDSGEFYMAFLVLTTILERALYDLYHRHEQSTIAEELPASKRLKSNPKACNGPPTATDIMEKKKKRKKNMILRDLLHSETLERMLPDGFLRLLKILFLPSGLNLRNLVWHGFMVPAEFPKCFSCLLVVLLLSLSQIDVKALDGENHEPVEDNDEPLFNAGSYNDRFVLNDPELRAYLHQLFGDKADRAQLQELLATAGHESKFIPQGRRNLVKKAFQALLETDDELWFLFALLPVLEHAIRIKFIATNQRKFGLSSEYGTAQIGAYYSTLDGFGQRDKHQVLLHSNVVLSDGDEAAEAGGFHLNDLYTTLPSAALAVCLDLFMMSSGPNLRAKLCHGEADLSTLPCNAPGHEEGSRLLSTASQLLLLTWLSLCRTENSAEALKRKPLNLAVQAFESSYSSSFHPFYQLQRALTTAFTAGKQFRELRSRWTRFRLDRVENPDSEAMVWVDFAIASDSSPTDDSATKFGVLEKASRIHEFQGLLHTASSLFSYNSEAFSLASPPKPQAKSFPALLEQLYTKLSTALTQLSQHFQASHDNASNSSAFLGLVVYPSGEQERSAGHIFDGDTALNRAIETHLLALSDEDGLSVAACMMEIVASSNRSHTSFQSRFLELQQLIADGKARTNHRRSFLNSVFFLPVFEIVQVLSLSLVEHQVMHLISLATIQREQQSEDPTIKGQPLRICPHARQFELLQRKLLQFVTAFEGCASDGAVAAQKSGEKALLLALQFLESKAMKAVTRE
ncbi:hypothetical protein Gpo141_00003881 [Globisporangium polare]